MLDQLGALILLFFSSQPKKLIVYISHYFLQILEKVKIAYDIPIVTDVHEAIQVMHVLMFKYTHKAFFASNYLE